MTGLMLRLSLGAFIACVVLASLNAMSGRWSFFWLLAVVGGLTLVAGRWLAAVSGDQQ